MENYIEVAETLYYKVNPNSKMDVPSSVYETVAKWNKQWQKEETDLSLLEWCLKYKQ